jgi:hypothetical protein
VHFPTPAEAAGATPSYLSDCGKYPVKQAYAVARPEMAPSPPRPTPARFAFRQGQQNDECAPADFDPHAATDAQLWRYGFPPRPKSGRGRARWEAFSPRHKIDYVVPEMCGNPNVTHRPRLRTRSSCGAAGTDLSVPTGFPPKEHRPGRTCS